MNIDGFWSIVERAHAGAPTNMKEKCRLLADELRGLSCDELVSFEDHFRTLFFKAYDWEIWAAAYIIEGGGCSNDSFMDFRSTLISLGRGAYEAALRNVDELVDFDIDAEWATYEGYQYVAWRVYKEKGCPPIDDTSVLKDPAKRHPKEPTGRNWKDWDLAERYPRLCSKYGWKKRDWSAARKANATFQEHMAKGAELAQLMLDAEIIPSCGLIPPPRILREVLRTGRSPSPSAETQSWEPFELDEGRYWIAARNLQERSKHGQQLLADLAGVKIAVDTEAPTAKTYAEWLESLKARGLMREAKT